MSRTIGKNNPAAYSQVYKNYNSDSVSLGVQVNDKAIRDQGVAHNGYEKVFALVPQENGEWKRFDLQYTGSYTDRGGGPPRDSYSLVLNVGDGVTLDALKAQGVAFGVEVDSGKGETLWLQGWGDNYKLHD